MKVLNIYSKTIVEVPSSLNGLFIHFYAGPFLQAFFAEEL